MEIQNNKHLHEDYNIVIKLTTNCPANCKCCSNRKREIKNKNEDNSIFEISYFDKICKNIKKIGGSFICLSGGEPTIVKNINDYFEIAHSYNLATRINTNGWNITTENFKKWLSLGLEQIVLSVYSLDANNTKNIRGNERLINRVYETSKIISEFKKSNHFKFIIQTVIMQTNYKEMADILEFAIQNNADCFWPSYLEDAINLPTVRMEENHILHFRNEIIPKMKRIIKNYGYINENISCESIDKLYNDTYENYIYHENKFQCDWLGRHLTFYPNGTIYPCPGHEYFSSPFQMKINFLEINEFITEENIAKNKQCNIENCKYCPQGVFQEIRLTK